MRPCRLSMDWPDGFSLRIGQFLKAKRGRTAYEITAMREVKRRDPAAGRRFVLTCERWNPTDVPDGATVHSFYWYNR